MILFLVACSGHKNGSERPENLTPHVTENGTLITFPTAESMSFFETEKIGNTQLNSEITAPAKVAAMVMKSDEGASQNIILFDNPELAGNYTLLIQHTININQIQNVNIKQKKIELDRVKDLQSHGAATGKDLLEAQTLLSMEETNLANEKAAIIEHETKLKAGGFNVEVLRKAETGSAYVICDIPENQISLIKENNSCTIQFTAFPNEKFKGIVDEVADMIDQTTRMFKMRITVSNAQGKLKAGMFATVSMGVSQGNNLSVNKNSLITVQAKSYVFVKTNATTFIRKEVSLGNEIDDRVIIYSGINSGDEVASKGVMQLKGLSFGY